MAPRPYKSILPQLGARVYVDETAAVIGDVVIGEDSSIWPLCSVRGDVNFIRIGSRTNIQDGTMVHGTHPHEALSGGYAVTIGDGVTIGHSCIIHGCAVESRCLIGMDSTLMDGAVLRSGVFLGAGSLVTEARSCWRLADRPVAKRLRPLTEQKSLVRVLGQALRPSENDYLK